jgi:hypothetical protein
MFKPAKTAHALGRAVTVIGMTKLHIENRLTKNGDQVLLL